LRYDALLAPFPPAIDEVPRHLLAPYVGVTPESRLEWRRKRAP
jgi:hypothetical protein